MGLLQPGQGPGAVPVEQGPLIVQIDEIGRDSVRLSLTANELLLINNAIDEVLHGIYISEVQTRLGVEDNEARKLLHELSCLLEKMA